ncbi:MAG TPA: hypothetical protein VGH59_04180 [Casimicrobiaceae bacterium]|jgi:hypothetical protein
MNISSLCFGCFWLFATISCLAADVGTVTLIDGKPRLLRGTAWYALVEGVRIRDTDVIDVPEKAQFQLEMTDGGALGLIGPGALYVVSMSPGDAKQRPVIDFWVSRGWLKFDTKPTLARLRMRSGMGSVTTSDAAAVVHLTADALEVFVETGSTRVVEPGKPDTAGVEVRGGSFASRAAGKQVITAERAPSTFIGALPRDFMDPLPLRIARFGTPREPVLDHEATYPEVQAWLAGPYRVAFGKRFEAKIATDPTFKAAVDATAKTVPDAAAAKAATPPAPATATAAKVEPPKEEKKAEPERTWRWPWERASGK